jgi:hypothetical protein
MTARVEFVYAQARLQACHGRMAGAAAWQALEASRTAGHYLALARGGPLAEWVDALEDPADAHRIERHLRARWRRRVDLVARWQPARWRPAVRWFGALYELSLIDARHDAGAAAPPDLTGDALLPALGDTDSRTIAQRWLAEWQRLLPPDAVDAALLRRPAELLLPRLRGADGERGAADEATRRALQRLFRRHGASALAALAHLALLALDVERLRGGLVVRVLFEPAPAPETT